MREVVTTCLPHACPARPSRQPTGMRVRVRAGAPRQVWERTFTRWNGWLGEARRAHVACCESFLALGWQNGMNQARRDITRMKKSLSNFVLVTGTRPGFMSCISTLVHQRIEGGAGEFPHACTWITCCICIRTNELPDLRPHRNDGACF